MIFGIKAGQLRFRAVIENCSNDPAQPDWQPFAVRTIGMELLKGREAERANQIYGASDTKITLRYLSGLNSTMRMVVDGRIYDLTGVLDLDNRHRIHICYATTVDVFNDAGVQVYRHYDFTNGGAKMSGTAAI